MDFLDSLVEELKKILDSFRNYLSPQILVVLSLGFISGVPYGVLMDPLNYWLSEEGIEKSTIGLLSLVFLIYSLKVFWAPLVDRLKIPGLHVLGQRRSWLFISQFVTGLIILSISFVEPKESLNIFVYLILAIGFFSATQDICADALRIELVEKRELGEASAVYVIGWRIGAILLSGVATFYLAELFGWSFAYLMIGIIVIFLSFIFLILIREPTREIRPPKDFFKEPLGWLEDSFLAPLKDLYLRYKNHLLLLLLLIFTYRLSDMFLGPMAMPFYRETGFTKIEVAEITNLYGLIMTILGGLFAGASVYRFGLSKNLVAGAILTPLTNLPFIYLNMIGHDVNFLIVTITLDNFTQGFVNVMGVTILGTIVSKSFTATQFAFLVALVSVPPRIISGGSGIIVDNMGFHEFFIICALLGIPAIIFSIMAHKRRQELGFE